MRRLALVSLLGIALLAPSAELLRAVTLGEERPVCARSEEGCWSQNRRSEVVLSGRRGS